jgi:hypothetical protein
MTRPDKKTNPLLERALFEATMGLLAPMVRESMLEDRSFREKYAIKTQAVLDIGNSDFAIDRDIFVGGIKKVLSGYQRVEIKNANGKVVVLEREKVGDGNIKLTSTESDKSVLLPDFYQFSSKKKIRLDGFKKVIKESYLSSDDAKKWESIFTKRPLLNEEFDVFNNDVLNTPMRIAEQIRNNTLSRKAAVSDLVPRSKTYYARLIGEFDGSETIKEFTDNVIKKRFVKLKNWNQFDGLSYFLLTASHSIISTLVEDDDLEMPEFIRVFEYLENSGDPISIVGAIEIGLNMVATNPDIEPVLIKLIELIRDDDLSESSKGIRLYASIVMMVDGELSRLKLFTELPPFYRRLASLSHAALIHRQLLHLSIDVVKFHDFVFGEQGMNFYMQTFSDMRIEPRWSPDMLEPSQVKADFMGRILIAAESNKERLKEKEVCKIIYGEDSKTVQANSNFPHSYMPGPLEGAEGVSPDVPSEFIDEIEAQLNSQDAGPGQFFMLLNSALIFKVDPKYAWRTAEILKGKQYHLDSVEDRSQLVNILSRLATLAAVTRSVPLADELLILLRVYSKDHEYKLTIDEYVRIGLEAAASRKDLKEWSAYLGNLFQNIAFSDLEYDDGVAAHSYLECLCRCVPQLWRTCAKADAAFQAFKAIQSH